eukprot:Hpha_TRINITY_DN16801_c4_g5::TRINITY_DN16801_c4_g5_i7::g.149628::m.149628
MLACGGSHSVAFVLHFLCVLLLPGLTRESLFFKVSCNKIEKHVDSCKYWGNSSGVVSPSPSSSFLPSTHMEPPTLCQGNRMRATSPACNTVCVKAAGGAGLRFALA